MQNYFVNLYLKKKSFRTITTIVKIAWILLIKKYQTIIKFNNN